MSRIELSKIASVSVHSEDVSRIAEPQFASHASFMISHADVTCTGLALFPILWYGLRTHGVASTNTSRRSCWSSTNMIKSRAKNHVSRPYTARTASPGTCFWLVTGSKTASNCILYGTLPWCGFAHHTIFLPKYTQYIPLTPE